jgi:hypothetical protein
MRQKQSEFPIKLNENLLKYKESGKEARLAELGSAVLAIRVLIGVQLERELLVRSLHLSRR